MFVHQESSSLTIQRTVTMPLNMNRVASVILAGGQGTRLFPLTHSQCKPAITVGGKFRLIDFPLSNAINSGCNKIFIITQFLSSSLHKHIFRTYQTGGPMSSGYIDLLTAEQRPNQQSWYQGTADAVRQNINYLCESSVDYFLILSGDQLYNMNLQNFVKFAMETDADAIIATLPLSEEDSKRMGVLEIDSHCIIRNFYEKPKEKEVLDKFRIPENIRDKIGLKDPNKTHLGSMGIYLFKRQSLIDLFRHDTREDFGKHLLPTKIQEGNVAAYIHNGYWEDIGTIKTFYQANLDLASNHPAFDYYDEANPIVSSPVKLPGAKYNETYIKNSIICDGAIVEADEVTNSVLGLRTVIKNGSIIRDSYIMGHDFYTPPTENPNFPDKLEIGEDCLIQKTIIDKHVRLGNRVHLVNKNKIVHYDDEENNVYIRDGIIVIARGADLPDGFTL